MVGLRKRAAPSSEPVTHEGHEGTTLEMPARRALTTLGIATTATVVGVLPPFLMGGLSVFMGPDLGFDESGLGLAVSLFFALASVLSVPAGRLGDRLGARRTLRLGMLASMVSLGGIGAVSQSWTGLVVFLAVGAVGNALSQMAGNVMIMTSTPYRRQAMSFAVKQSSAPFATLAGGAAVPLVGLTVGWRWAFIASALLCLLLVVPLPPGKPPAPSAPGAVARGPLLLLAAAAACAAAAANSSGAFLVPALTSQGMDPGPAGGVLALGGAIAIASRMVGGWAGDRYGMDGLLASCLLVGAGAVGFAAMAFQPRGAVLAITVLLMFGGGWGFNGLLIFAVVRRHPHAPGTATGMTQTGVFAGGVFGPLIFAFAATSFGYRTAWAVLALVALVATACFASGRALLYRTQAAGA